MRNIGLLLFSAALISAAPTDTGVPDYYEAHTDAQSTIDQLLQDGQDDSACRNLAKTTIKDVKTNVETSQKSYDAVDKGFNCDKEGQDAVVKANEQKTLAEKTLKDATNARETACSAPVTFAPRAYNTMKENECSTFFSDSAYTSAKKKCADSKSAEAKAEGEVSASIKAVKSAEEAAAKARAECECKTHQANKKAFEAATKNHEANKKAWVKAHHMLCVLDGTSPDKCVVPSVPVVAKAPVCQKCDGSTCNALECKHTTKGSNQAGVVKPDTPAGYTLTGGGMNNQYRNWDKLSGFEQMYPDGNHFNCDTGFGAGKLTCYGISCKKGDSAMDCVTKSQKLTGSGVTRVSLPAGYVMTGGGLYNHYRSFDKKSLFERSHPEGNQWVGDMGAGAGDFTTYVRGCKGVECKTVEEKNSASAICPSGYQVTGCGLKNNKGWEPKGGFAATHPKEQGCACASGFGSGNAIPTWTTDSLLQQSSTSGGDWISTKKITSTPPTDSKLIPHPGYVVKIAYRNGAKFRSTEFNGFKDYVFKDTSKYKLTHVSDLTKIPADTDVMFDFLPDKAYTSTEIEALKKFLDAGFRLVLMGEHSGYAPLQNDYISKAVKAMGGGVEVLKGTEQLRDLTAAKNQIADVALTSGVFKFGVAAWAPLKVDAAVTEVVMADSNGKIFMADQVLRKGRLTIWADKNLFANAYGNKDGRNSPFFYNLVHQAAFYKKEVKAGRDPNEYANEKLKAEKEGKPPPPKPVIDYTGTNPTPQTTPTSAPTSAPTKAAPTSTGDYICYARCCK